jgi:hypothetical protein
MDEPFMGLGSTAMWNLSGDDISRAKEELKGRRAAIQARYENELKQLEVAIGDLETFERAALNFVLNFKGEEAQAAPPAPVAEPDPMPEPVVVDSAGEQQSAELELPAVSERASAEKGSSRWRMRLSTTEAAP